MLVDSHLSVVITLGLLQGNWGPPHHLVVGYHLKLQVVRVVVLLRRASFGRGAIFYLVGPLLVFFNPGYFSGFV